MSATATTVGIEHARTMVLRLRDQFARDKHARASDGAAVAAVAEGDSPRPVAAPQSARTERLFQRIAAGELHPSPALDLPHEGQFATRHSWLGELDRFETVKALRRSSHRNTGARVDEDDVSELVYALEEAEELMGAGRFLDALLFLGHVALLAPSCAVAYYRMGLCALALDDAQLGSVGVDACPREDGREEPPGARSMRLASRCFGLAVRTEPDNAALRGNVDLALRIMSEVPIPAEYWTAEFPKSQGDVAALSAYVLRHCGEAPAGGS